MNESAAGRFSEVESAHRHFSADCFNRTWELIDKPDRTPADNEQMLLLAYASLWHWTQRPDCTPRNLSVGYWLLSRVYSLLGVPKPARYFGELSLQHAEHEPPFYIGYAHEALARAALVAGDRLALARHFDLARKLAADVEDAEDRALLDGDLKSLL
jgi:hypothetical protein